MCKIISVINNKGGVAKTTSTGVVAEILANIGKRVLVIDLDEQCNLSMLFNSFVEDSEEVVKRLKRAEVPNITEVMLHRYKTNEEMQQVIQKTEIENLDIIPASKRFKDICVDINKNTGNNNTILKKAIRAVKDDYDFIFIDNAPANNILTVNSMFASDFVITPVKGESFSYKGLMETLTTLYYIKEEHELDELEFKGTFITLTSNNTCIYKAVKENYTNELEEKFFNTSIRKDVKIEELETVFRPILEYAPKCNAVYDYMKLIKEMEILDETGSKKLDKMIKEREV